MIDIERWPGRRKPDEGARDRDDLDALRAAEPFVQEGKMVFTRVTEFEAAQFQPSLADWFADKGM